VALITPGTEVDVRIFREGRQMTLDVTVGELEAATAALGRATPEVTAGIGMTVEPLTPRIAQQLGISRDLEGVVVTEVEAGSVAEKSGIVRGDVVLAVGRERVRSVSDFRVAMRDADLDRGVRLRLNSRGMQRFVFLKRG
jgi:serine protease Do